MTARSSLTRRDVLSLRGFAPAPSSVVHIASLLVQVVPKHADAAIALAARFAGAEVHRSDHPGRFVVVLESADDRAVSRYVDELHVQQGVLTVSIVSHLIEDADRLEEVVDDVSESAGVSQA